MNDSGTVSKHPFDFDSLKKGDSITDGEVARAMMVENPGDYQAMQLAKLAFCNMAQKALWERELYATVAQVNGVVRVLTDEEASAYNERRFEQNYLGMRRSFNRNSKVELENLSEEQRGVHCGIIRLQAAVVCAAHKAKRIALKEHKANVPSLNEVKQLENVTT